MMEKILQDIFGMKIKRTTDLIAVQGREAFWQTGIDLDAKLTSIVVSLYEEGSGTSTDISNATGLSRQLVEKRLKQLMNEGYVVSSPHPSDARKRSYQLGPNYADEVKQVVQTMRDFEAVYEEIWKEIGVDMGQAMLQLEKALKSRPLLSRLCTKYPKYNDHLTTKEHDSA